MARISTWITVVAGALSNSDGRFLMQRRPQGKEHGGLWEFPGGKVEPGESPRIALIRELNEELTLDIAAAAIEPLVFAESDPHGDRPGIVILLYRIFAWQGEPRPEEGAEVGWFTVAAIRELPLPPLDSLLIESIAGQSE